MKVQVAPSVDFLCITLPPTKSQNNSKARTPPPPIAQPRPRFQKSRQNNGSTPTPCFDKPVLVRDTHGIKARVDLKPYKKHGTMHKQHPK